MSIIKVEIKDLITSFYSCDDSAIQFQKTKKDFEGDITLIVFPLLKISNKGVEETSYEIGNYLVDNIKEIIKFNIVKGFLNLTLSDRFWIKQFYNISKIKSYGIVSSDNTSETYVVEYSSPNTNKPLHLGHIRNIILGYSVSEILKASGKNVKKVQVINDRGIHICKSMLAWKDYGEGETPISSGLKGDHLAGKYYVKFNNIYVQEVEELIKSGVCRNEAEQQAPILKKAQDMLVKWEEKDENIIKLWNRMNNWVYEGFDITYNRLGVDFDKNYYESDTYLLGKDLIKKGVDNGIFYKKSDDSVWVDLSKYRLDDKILLRSDGTSVYITQDIGTAIQRHSDFLFTNMVYTVGNEQNHHFKVLFAILELLGFEWSQNCTHLSYGMVDLPTGKMKSREGAVVDADDLMQETVSAAKRISKELGKLNDLSEEEVDVLYEKIGLGALKYFILKIDPKKNMLFNPEESIDFNGNTGPFIQYTYARIQSLLRKYNQQVLLPSLDSIVIADSEKSLVKLMLDFPSLIQEAAYKFSPALIANYVYDLSKEFNQFYQSTSILNSSSEDLINWRLSLAEKIAEIIKQSMHLLGIDVPERM